MTSDLFHPPLLVCTTAWLATKSNAAVLFNEYFRADFELMGLNMLVAWLPTLSVTPSKIQSPSAVFRCDERRERPNNVEDLFAVDWQN